MKFFISIIFIAVFFTGCTFFGWYENGNPSVVMNTELDNWKRDSTSEKNKLNDWIHCGGATSGEVKFSPQNHKGIPTYDEAIKANSEYDSAQACMMKKGYIYTGKCRAQTKRRLACKSKSFFH